MFSTVALVFLLVQFCITVMLSEIVLVGHIPSKVVLR